MSNNMTTIKQTALKKTAGRARKPNKLGNTHIALKVEEFNELNEVGASLAKSIGVKLSAKQVVLYLMNYWNERNKP